MAAERLSSVRLTASSDLFLASMEAVEFAEFRPQTVVSSTDWS